jgi:hypothetical protein
VFACPNCGADRRTIAPIAPCPSCGVAFALGEPVPKPASAMSSDASAQGLPLPQPKPAALRSSRRNVSRRSERSIVAVLLLALLVVAGWFILQSQDCQDARREISRAATGSGNQVVMQKQLHLRDGEAIILPLGEGPFSVHMTATGDGASLKWIGAPDCNGCGETSSCTSYCNLPRSGQVQVSNPTTLGLGATVTVSVDIRRGF